MFFAFRKPNVAWVHSWWVELEMMLSVLNNFCFSNATGKNDLVNRGITEKLLNLWTSLIKLNNPSSPPIDLVKSSLESILKLLTTLTCGCELAKSALVKYSVIANENSVAKDNPQQNMLQHLLNVCKSDDKNPSIQLFQSLEGQSFFASIAYPSCFRIVMSSMTNKDCRLNIVRNKFPENCLKFIEYERDQRDTKHKRKTATEVTLSSKRRNFSILWFDFLLSFTTFPDGQLWLGSEARILDTLVDIAAADLYSDKSRLDLSGLAALAILRNVCFNSVNRTRLLLSKKFLNLLAKKVVVTKQDLNITNHTKQAENIALSAIWALSANNHKAKVAFSEAGITNLLNEESHRREIEKELKNRQMNLKSKVRFLEDKENIEALQSTSMLKEVLNILLP